MIRKYARVAVSTPSPLLRLVSLGLVTYIFTLFSLELSLIGSILAPLWFSTSVMLVALYRNPARLWSAILLTCSVGSVLANMTLFASSKIDLLFPAINVVQAVIGALLLRRFLPYYNPLQNLNNWLRLALGSAVIPPLAGASLLLLLTHDAEPLHNFTIWFLSEAIGALALVPIGLLFKSHYLLKHRNPRLLMETLLTLIATLVLSWVSLRYLPWPFTFIIVLLMWSAIRLPRMEAFTVFLATVMVVSLIITTTPSLLEQHYTSLQFSPEWLPFLMILLPANVMTMVMYAFRVERKHIAESETRFRNAMEYSVIGMALVSHDGRWMQANRALCNLLGYSQEQLRDLTFQELTWPEDLPADVAQLARLRDGEINNYTLEKRYTTRAGNVVWTLLAMSVVRHHDGSPHYYIAQIEDINDLKQSESLNKRLVERIMLANEAGGIGIWEWDLKSDVVSWDKRMFELYDVLPDRQPSYALWRACLVKDDLDDTETVIKQALQARVPFKLEFRIHAHNGVRHIRALANRVLDDQGDVERLLGINIDMTEVKQLNEALFQEKERLHITLDAIGEAVICTNEEMRITFMNPVAELMCGWPQSQAIGQSLLTVLRITWGKSGAPAEDIHDGIAASNTFEQDMVLHCRDGGIHDIHYSVTPLSTLTGENIGHVVVIQDVTESRKTLRQLSYSASHDGLTHLANRLSFENHLKRLLLNLGESHQHHALVFIDLDRFKSVNDSAGHAAGDALLRELATLMLGQLRPSDVLARLGGDEFGLLLPDCSLDSARVISTRLIQSINDFHFVWDNRLHRIGASAGITLIDEHNDQASDVLSQADIACYASKNSGRGIVTVYEPQQRRLQQARVAMPPEEQLCIINDSPLVMVARAVASPRVPEATSFYTLTLQFWTSDGEMLEESAFRSTLGDPALMLSLDERVFNDFFCQWSHILAQKGFGVALPLSAVGLASTTFIGELLMMLAQSDLPPHQLHFLVHADALHRDDDAPRQGLQRLRSAGCSIVLVHSGRDLDVFDQLGRDMVDFVMLNAALVSWVHLNMMDEMMVTINHGYAQRLGLLSIAGPADTPPALATLAQIGIDLVYGDTIAPALPLPLLLSNSYFAIN